MSSDKFNPRTEFPELYSPSIPAKLFAVASRSPAGGPAPTYYPEYTRPGGPHVYECSTPDCWTSGFFPGSLWLLLMRERLAPGTGALGPISREEWKALADHWTRPLAVNANLTNTHDLGFMMLPFILSYSLNRDEEAKGVILKAAHNLSNRFDERVGAIRSWDTCVTTRYTFGPDRFNTDYLTIIDNMMNLDLLYTASTLAVPPAPSFTSIASSHALKSSRSHIRADGSTCHVVNFDPVSGEVKERFANQGYTNESCWSRGQAWGIYGFAICAQHTGSCDFLSTAIALADYFLSRLPEDGTPHWDFDCPRPTHRDTSAATCAANGLLLIYLSLTSPSGAFSTHPLALSGAHKYFAAATKLIRDILNLSLAPAAEWAASKVPQVDLAAHGEGWDTILMNATINNFQYAPRRWADHGLVYGDYYLVEFGNRLLEMQAEGRLP